MKNKKKKKKKRYNHVSCVIFFVRLFGVNSSICTLRCKISIKVEQSRIQMLDTSGGSRNMIFAERK